MTSITIDGKEFDLTNISPQVQTHLDNLRFVNEQILQRNNELQITETAKLGYTLALKREIEKIDDR